MKPNNFYRVRTVVRAPLSLWNRSALYFLLMMTVALMLSACFSKPLDSLKIPESSPLSGDIGWALVTGAYAQLKDSPSADGSYLAFLRKGDYFKIMEREYDGAKSEAGTLWYRVDSGKVSGWVDEASVRVFKTKEQAQKYVIP